MQELVFLLVGLAGVVLGARLAVDNAARIARRYGVSEFVLGVTLLAIGSDLPELVVSLSASVRSLFSQDTSDLIVGNALGSGFGQIGLSLGVAACIGPMLLTRANLIRHGSLLLTAMLLLGLLASDGRISRVDGAVLTLAFVGYLVLTFHNGVERGSVRRSGALTNRLWVLIAIGLAVLIGSSELVVTSAIELARIWRVDQALVGIAIIGLGTSLPELAMAVRAALQGHGEMSVGNLLGSNVLDMLLPIGLAALIYPLRFAPELLRFDLVLLFLLTVVVLGLFWRRGQFGAVGGVFLMLLYGGYLAATVSGSFGSS